MDELAWTPIQLGRQASKDVDRVGVLLFEEFATFLSIKLQAGYGNRHTCAY